MSVVNRQLWRAGLGAAWLVCGGWPLADAYAQQVGGRHLAPPAGARTASGAALSSVWIDVRTPQEYAQGHVAGAVLIPLDSLAVRIAQVVPERRTRLYLYCRSGRRSGIAQKVLQSMGYSQVDNAGGLADVQRRGMPIVAP